MRKIFLVTDYLCNNLCISCAKKVDENGRLSKDQIKERFKAIKPSIDDYIEISGGEPTIRDDIVDICSHIKENYKTNLILLSNGRRFKDISFAMNIKDSGIDRVMSTFYGHYAEMHDEITQRTGSFNDTLQGLRNLEKIGVPISVKTIILKQNYKNLPEFIEFGVDNFPSAWLSIHGLIIRGRAKDNIKNVIAEYRMVQPYLEKALDTAMEKQKNVGVFIYPYCILDPVYWRFLSVGWKGMAKSMIYISPEETIYGNMSTSQPEYCRDCMIGDNCSWAWESAWREYIDVFGTKELNKVVKNDIKIKDGNNTSNERL